MNHINASYNNDFYIIHHFHANLNIYKKIPKNFFKHEKIENHQILD